MIFYLKRCRHLALLAICIFEKQNSLYKFHCFQLNWMIPLKYHLAFSFC